MGEDIETASQQQDTLIFYLKKFFIQNTFVRNWLSKIFYVRKLIKLQYSVYGFLNQSMGHIQEIF